MELMLDRFKFTEERTYGDLSIDGVWECYTLEDKVRELQGEPVSSWKVPGKTAIPVGRYKVEMTMSQRFGRVMIQLMDVEGFTGVRIHSGGDEDDTEGCPLVGDFIDKNGIHGGKLRGVLDRLENKIHAAIKMEEDVWITVVGLA